MYHNFLDNDIYHFLELFGMRQIIWIYCYCSIMTTSVKNIKLTYIFCAELWLSNMNKKCWSSKTIIVVSLIRNHRPLTNQSSWKNHIFIANWHTFCFVIWGFGKWTFFLQIYYSHLLLFVIPTTIMWRQASFIYNHVFVA